MLQAPASRSSRLLVAFFVALFLFQFSLFVVFLLSSSSFASPLGTRHAHGKASNDSLIARKILVERGKEKWAADTAVSNGKFNLTSSDSSLLRSSPVPVSPTRPVEVVVGVFTSYTTDPYNRAGKYNYTRRRELLRQAWFPSAATRRYLEETHGVVIRWVVGAPPPPDALQRLLALSRPLTLPFKSAGKGAQTTHAQATAVTVDLRSTASATSGLSADSTALQPNSSIGDGSTIATSYLPRTPTPPPPPPGPLSSVSSSLSKSESSSIPDGTLSLDLDPLHLLRRQLQDIEAEEAQDPSAFLRLPSFPERYGSLAAKTKAFLREVTGRWQPRYVLKIDDDVLLRLDTLLPYLRSLPSTPPPLLPTGPTPLPSSPPTYLGCFKQGSVIADPRYRWFEPAHTLLGPMYPLHAWGSAYVLTGELATQIAALSHTLKEFTNEDVSMGIWALALNATFHHDDRFCMKAQDACPGAFRGGDGGALEVVTSTSPSSTEIPTRGKPFFVAYEFPKCAGFCQPSLQLQAAIEKGGWACLGPRTVEEWRNVTIS